MLSNASFDYWRTTADESPLRISGHWDERGTLDFDGAAYHEPGDIEEVEGTTTLVGLSYQIASLTNVNECLETFKVVLDLNVLYKIDDADVPIYKQYQGFSIKAQQIVDDGRIKVNPPVWEIRNAAESPQIITERLAGGPMQCYDHRNDRWAWYVSFYTQLRVECYEVFEMQRFPFTRIPLQIQLQSKMADNQVLLVPYNCRSAMPHWQLFNDQEVKKMFARGNTYKTDKVTGNWEVETHHVAFVPRCCSPPMPSGNRFSMAIITIQCKQHYKYYIVNTVPVVFFLPVLAATAVFEGPENIADRMSIVLALLLTMATYKVSISTWIPQKDYLTFMDQYIIVGFIFILLVAAFVGTTSLAWMFTDGGKGGCRRCDSGTDEVRAAAPGWVENFEKIEEIAVSILMVVWCTLHVWAGLRLKSFYQPWPEILRKENEDKVQICTDVTQERQEIMDCKMQTNSQVPLPPELPEHPEPPVAEELSEECKWLLAEVPPQNWSSGNLGLPGEAAETSAKMTPKLKLAMALAADDGSLGGLLDQAQVEGDRVSVESSVPHNLQPSTVKGRPSHRLQP